jgi:hypothetical protein
MKLFNTTDFPDYFLRRMVSWCCKQLDMPVGKLFSATFRNRTYSRTGHCKVAWGEIVIGVVKRRKYEIAELRAGDIDQLSRRDLLKNANDEPDWTPPADPVVVHCRIGDCRNEFIVERSDAEQRLATAQQSSDDHRLKQLVSVTAHEVAHRMLYLNGSRTRKSRRWGTTSSGGSEQQTIWHEKQVWKKFEANRDELLAAWMKEPAKRQAKPKPSIQEQRAAKVQKKLAEWQRKLKLAQTKLKKYKQQARYYEKAIAAKG